MDGQRRRKREGLAAVGVIADVGLFLRVDAHMLHEANVICRS